jgi:hypothetical protein
MLGILKHPELMRFCSRIYFVLESILQSNLASRLFKMVMCAILRLKKPVAAALVPNLLVAIFLLRIIPFYIN